MKIALCRTSAFVIPKGLECVPSEGVRANVTDIRGEPVEGTLVLREIGQSSEMAYPLSAGECVVPSEALVSGKKYEISLIAEKKRISAGEIFVTTDDILGKCCYPVCSDNIHLWCVCADLIALLGETCEKLDAHVDGTDII